MSKRLGKVVSHSTNSLSNCCYAIHSRLLLNPSGDSPKLLISPKNEHEVEAEKVYIHHLDERTGSKHLSNIISNIAKLRTRTRRYQTCIRTLNDPALL